MTVPQPADAPKKQGVSEPVTGSKAALDARLPEATRTNRQEEYVSPFLAIDPRQIQRESQEFLRKKLEAGHTLRGRRKDGKIVAINRDGERVIDRFPAVG